MNINRKRTKQIRIFKKSQNIFKVMLCLENWQNIFFIEYFNITVIAYYHEITTIKKPNWIC